MKTERLHLLGAAVLVTAAAGLAWYGQPTPEQKWNFLAPELEPRLLERQVQIEPAELMGLMHDDYIDLHLIDVRGERDWNLFHLRGAQRVPLEDLPTQRQHFAQLSQNGVIVFVSNDEALATEAWKQVMVTALRPNAYILAGGVNRWLREFAGEPTPAGTGDGSAAAGGEEALRYPLQWALGARHPAALPDPHEVEPAPFTKKVKLMKRVVKKGGCG